MDTDALSRLFVPGKRRFLSRNTGLQRVGPAQWDRSHRSGRSGTLHVVTACAGPAPQCHDGFVHRSRDRSAPPVAITSVARSLDDQHDARRRKYLIMMGLRIVCVIAAAAVFRTSLWLALVFMVGGAVLPWCAVLIANDRPARSRTAFIGYRPPSSQRQLPRQQGPGPGPDATHRGSAGPSREHGIEWLDPDQDR